MGAGAAAALSDGAATAAGETEGASLEESAEKKERRSGFWEGSQKEGRRVDFLLAPPSPATSSTIAKNEKKKLKEEQRRAEKSKTPLSSNNDSAAPNRRTMRVTPGETDALPTRAAPAAGAAGGAPLTRRTSFAATTAISRRSSNAAAAADASKGGDYEEGLPLDVVEEPDSLTEHGMPVVFEVRQAEMQGGGREAKGEEGPIEKKGPAGDEPRLDSRRRRRASTPELQQARAFRCSFSLARAKKSKSLLALAGQRAENGPDENKLSLREQLRERSQIAKPLFSFLQSRSPSHSLFLSRRLLASVLCRRGIESVSLKNQKEQRKRSGMRSNMACRPKKKKTKAAPPSQAPPSLSRSPRPLFPLDLSFKKKKKKKQSLTYVVRNEAKRSQKLTLLHGVTGALLPGQLSALMGPSGSSKTTLLDVLAGRKTVGDISGTLRFAGHPASRTFLRRYTGYVEQFDTLLANLTVAEMLMYTAELKNPLATPAATKVARVNAVIEQLALAPCRDVRIGSSLARGISGGQAKRVNIGIALVTSPRVLFLDEPTSGLDSFTANEVMTVVKGLVKTGITICATIHSPTPYCFNLFDRLMILLRGKVVYAGENGHAAVEYFERAFPEVPRFSANGRTTGKGGEPADPNSSTTVFHNRAEWIVDVTTKADRDGLGGSFADAYAASELAAANAAAVARMLSERVPVSATVAAELATRSGTTTPAWWGVRTLLKYRMARDYRDASFLGPRIADKAVLSLIIMSLYWRVGADHSQSNVNNLTAVLFLWAIMPGYTASAYVPALVLERSLFVRERADGLYRPVTYLLSKMIEELVIAFFNTLVFGAVVFFPCKLAGSFPHFWAVYFTTTATGIALGYAIASAAPNMDVANAALPAYVTTLLFFVGLLLRPQDQPKYWRWYAYIDFLKYAWQAQMVNQFEGEQTLRALDGGSILDFYSIGDANKWEQVRCVFCSPFVSSREGNKTEEEKRRGKKTHTQKNLETLKKQKQQVAYESFFFWAFAILAWASLAFKRHQKR
jgi:ATP-binding cassette, subfamily G (WHITE), member 2